jgi:hypothetical protein
VERGLDALAWGLGLLWVACGGANPARATLERITDEAGVRWSVGADGRTTALARAEA